MQLQRDTSNSSANNSAYNSTNNSTDNSANNSTNSSANNSIEVVNNNTLHTKINDLKDIIEKLRHEIKQLKKDNRSLYAQMLYHRNQNKMKTEQKIRADQLKWMKAR